MRMKRVSPLRFLFDQSIVRISDEKLMLKGKVFGTSINKRRRPELQHIR